VADAASNGDELVLAAGTYPCGVSISKALALRSTGGRATFDCLGASRGLLFTDVNVNVSGVDVVNGFVTANNVDLVGEMGRRPHTSALFTHHRRSDGARRTAVGAGMLAVFTRNVVGASVLFTDCAVSRSVSREDGAVFDAYAGSGPGIAVVLLQVRTCCLRVVHAVVIAHQNTRETKCCQDSRSVLVRAERCRLTDNVADHDGALYLDFVGRTQNSTVQVLQVRASFHERAVARRIPR
jgi:hypothetical protein